MLPNVTCPTSFGITDPDVQASTAQVRTDVPAALASQLATYTDRAGILTIVGPRGWQCEASIGADGTGVLVVVPPQESLNPEPTGFLPDQREGIGATETSACAGCRYALVCPVLIDPGDQATYGPCANSRPPAETVSRLSASSASFEDPPNVAGDGSPSGGPNPANGVVLLQSTAAGSAPEDQTGFGETCTLPAAEHSICTAILDEFLARYR
ncbi:MAG TPA: hypothetical protein VKY26_10430 [Actinomycetota bacterium]|nr:hypothetical protein [Actinomycetota bacterium]